ncbi:unnamed protein product [Citrullus colocynthis]|uniref:Secreted protein n=1 Tax=Citrullus colocynthis TaxID=252529 RepID=A0ABP0YQT8_9ROSI
MLFMISYRGLMLVYLTLPAAFDVTGLQSKDSGLVKMKKTPCNLGARLDHPVYWKKNKQNAEAKGVLGRWTDLFGTKNKALVRIISKTCICWRKS